MCRHCRVYWSLKISQTNAKRYILISPAMRVLRRLDRLTPPSTFTADTCAQRVLLPLAELLFDDFSNFGRLANIRGVCNGAFQRYSSRAQFIVEYLTALGNRAGLRFSPDAHVAFVSNTIQWSSHAPQAGYTGGEDDPLPSDVAYSLLAGWASDNEARYPYARSERAAALWFDRHGLEAALCLLLDLRSGGFIPDEEALVFGVLALARRRAAARWDRPRLLELALDLVAALRAAKSFDEWLVACSLARTTLNFLCPVLEPGAPLALRAALSRFEDIAADSYSFLVAYELSPASGDWQAPDALRRHEEGMCWGMAAGSAVRARLQRQRVLRPDELEGMELRIGPQLPRRWRHLSWRLIKSAGAFVDTTDPGAVEMCKPVPEVLLDEPPINLDAMLARLAASNDDRESLEICRTLLEWLPWSALLRLELAIRLDETGENDQARQVIIEALTLAPDDPDIWQSTAVILFQGGAHEEADIATRIEGALRDRKRPPSI